MRGHKNKHRVPEENRHKIPHCQPNFSSSPFPLSTEGVDARYTKHEHKYKEGAAGNSVFSRIKNPKSSQNPINRSKDETTEMQVRRLMEHDDGD